MTATQFIIGAGAQDLTWLDDDIDENSQIIYPGPCVLTGYMLTNASSTVRAFLKLYDSASVVNLVTDYQLLKAYFGIPKGQSANVSFPRGILFSSGLVIAASGAAGVADATPLATQALGGTILYKPV